MELCCVTYYWLMTDIRPGPQCQGPSLAQDIDFSCASELRVPGSFPVPTIRGHTSAPKTSQSADHGDGVLSTPQDLSRFKHATEYFIAFAIQQFLEFIPMPQACRFSACKDRKRTLKYLVKPQHVCACRAQYTYDRRCHYVRNCPYCIL